MIATKVVTYPWPACQICLECRHNASGLLTDETGLITSLHSHPFVVCAANETRNDGVSCPSLEPEDGVID